MKNLKFNSFLAVEVFKKNKVFTAKKEVDLNRDDFFIATLKNGYEFAICKVKKVNKFKTFNFLDEFEAVEFDCKSANKVIATKKDIGFNNFNRLKKFYNNYFGLRKNGVLIEFENITNITTFLNLQQEIKKIIEKEKQNNNFLEECKKDSILKTICYYDFEKLEVKK